MPNIRKTMMGAAGASSDPGGSLWGWGYNGSGQLGQGNTTNYSSPVQVGALTDWLLATNGSANHFANPIKNDGTFWGIGGNAYGQLGLGDTTNRSSPVQVGALTNWFQAAGGDGHNVAIKTDGTLWAWGWANQGQTGHGDTTTRSSPVQVGSLTDWKGAADTDALLDGENKLGAGSYNTHVIKSDGTLWGWGWGAQKTGGWGDTSSRSSPVQIGSGTDWANLSPAYSYTIMAVKTDGTLWAWGKGDYGQLGQGNTTDHDSPVQVGALTTWKYVGNGYHWSCAVKSDGTLWAWGRNNKGQLGLGDTTNRSSPVQVGSLTNWLLPVSGYEYNRVLKTDGTLWVNGNNNYGQLAQGNTTDTSSPVQVGSVTTWIKVLGGKYNTLAVQQT